MTDLLPEIQLFPGRERSVLLRHPWIYSGAIKKVTGDPQAGDTVMVLSSNGDKLGLAGFSPTSQIRARIWTFDPAEQINKEFFEAKITRALQTREHIRIRENTDALRLIYAESDGIPGLIVDDYADYLVVQILSTSCEKWKNEIIEILAGCVKPKGIYERSDVEVRKLEGLALRVGVMWGEEPPDLVTIHENGLKFLVDIKNGQKTGFFLDQRQNRADILQFAEGKDLLNCFCYTGAFTVYGLKGGAQQTTSIDSSSDAIALAKKNVEGNGFAGGSAEFIEGDVFQELRKFRDSRRQFDVIMLDPPKFAATQALVEKAARAYKDINLLAFKLLRPGGILFTFSCSGGVNMELFQKIVAGAALDAGADAQIIKYLYQDSDHPISLHFPESAYLKGLVCRIS